MSEPVQASLGRVWFALWDEPNLARTTLLGGGICLTILLVSFTLTRFDDSWPLSDYGVWLFFSVVIGYVVANGSYLLPKTLEDLDALRPILTLEDDAYARLRHGVLHHPRAAMHLFTILGLTTGIIHDASMSGTTTFFARGELPPPLIALISLCTITVWTLMFQLGAALTRNAVVFSQVGRNRVRLSLFDHRPLAPFGRTALRPALLLVGVQIAFPLLWTQPSFHYIEAVPGLIATTSVIIATFLLPMLGIHRRLRENKRAAVDRVSTAIASLEGILDDDAPAAMENEKRTRLTELVTLRREIEAVTAWPIDAPLMRHLGVYLLLPPLTWVGAALIQNAVDAFL